MANTDVVLALPTPEYKGSYIESPFTPWSYSTWYLMDNSVKTALVITGFTYTTMSIPPVDTTVEAIFDIGVGDLGKPVVKIQIPTSQRSDTAVGIYLPPRTIFLPEPVQVSAGSAIYIRVASSRNHQAFNGIRLLVQAADSSPISPLTIKPNNYKSISSSDMSVVTGVG